MFKNFSYQWKEICRHQEAHDMIIYLDDWRTPPKIENLKSATNFEDFVFLLDTYSGCIDIVDLDYDLGYDSMRNGLDVLKYMNKYDIKCEHINIHSTHPVGRERMLQYAQENFPDSVVTTG